MILKLYKKHTNVKKNIFFNKCKHYNRLFEIVIKGFFFLNEKKVYSHL